MQHAQIVNKIGSKPALLAIMPKQAEITTTPSDIQHPHILDCRLPVGEYYTGYFHVQQQTHSLEQSKRKRKLTVGGHN